MKILKLAFASLWTGIPLIFFYALACAIATFIENDYGTPTARALVYDTWWFNAIHLYLLIVLVGCFIASKAWQRKKYASLLLHFSFVVIILGAGVTRFFGFEGIMHIREGSQSNFILSNETYLSIKAINSRGDQELSFIPANLIPGQTLKKEITLFGKPLQIVVDDVQKLTDEKQDSRAKLNVKLTFNKKFEENIALIGGIGIEGQPITLQSPEITLTLSWGVRKVGLPFSIELKDFQLDRYPGSMSPSSYASEINIIDDHEKIFKSFRIFMNNVLDHGGYRFFQSSYDKDEQGTILSVNNDPGKNLTYLGYTLLILGSLWLLFDKNGRFRRLSRFLQSQKVASFLLFALMLGTSTPIYSQQPQPLAQNSALLLNNLKHLSKDFSEDVDSLLVQDFGGRIKPLNTLATDMIHKITKNNHFLGLSNTQLFLGMMMMPEDFQKLKMIKISNPELKKLLGVEGDYIAFRDGFTQDGVYVLQNYVEEANRKKPSSRGTFDKEILSVDERINLAYLIYTGEVFRIFPDVSGNNTWLQPLQAIQSAINLNKQEEAQRISHILKNFVIGFNQGVKNNQWDEAAQAVSSIRQYQKEHGADLIVNNSKIHSEILLNKTNFFNYLIIPYILLGVIFFGIILVYVCKNQAISRKITLSFYLLLALMTTIFTATLALRWYVSGHAPWSNAYESMLYVAWASSFGALVFFKKSPLALSSASFFSGICLFVANLGFMDPQITNLVPVLKSYWLNIHVSIITGSYGFLGLCFILGLITLLMFLLRSTHRSNIDSTIFSLTAINEMTMMIGLFMLTIGNFLGGVWANESWGRYWGWDPKETWALISIGVYAIILHLRFLRFKNMPFIFASASVIGFFSILMTYFGVNYYLSGMHSYAAGDPLPIPTFVYFLVAGVFLLILFASFKRKLQFPKI